MTKFKHWTDCELHGERPATFVCQHLGEYDGLGFHVGYDEDNPDELYPTAWCDECDVVLQNEGGWSPAAIAYAELKKICAICYYETRQNHWVQDEELFARLSAASYRYLKLRQNEIAEDFAVGQHQQFDWDQETGKLIFSKDGLAQVECDISFVGSYSKRSETWMWAWANTSVTDKVKQNSRTLRALGEELNFLKLASPIWPAEEWECWEMTAIMARALGAIGAYRGPDKNGFTYMILSSAKWVNTRE